MVGLVLGLRPEAALHGVRVSVLCPGAVETPALDRLPADGLPRTATPPVTARQYLSVVRQKPVEVDRFARLALKSVARDRAIIAVPASAPGPPAVGPDDALPISRTAPPTAAS